MQYARHYHYFFFGNDFSLVKLYTEIIYFNFYVTDYP
jgi:hypothetical protein